jgi:hypothetical protein
LDKLEASAHSPQTAPKQLASHLPNTSKNEQS